MNLPEYKPTILDDDAFEVFLDNWIADFTRALREAWPNDADTKTVLYKYIS